MTPVCLLMFGWTEKFASTHHVTTFISDASRVSGTSWVWCRYFIIWASFCNCLGLVISPKCTGRQPLFGCLVVHTYIRITAWQHCDETIQPLKFSTSHQIHSLLTDDLQQVLLQPLPYLWVDHPNILNTIKHFDVQFHPQIIMELSMWFFQGGFFSAWTP